MCGGDPDEDLDLKLDPFSNMDIIQKLAGGLSCCGSMESCCVSRTWTKYMFAFFGEI